MRNLHRRSFSLILTLMLGLLLANASLPSEISASVGRALPLAATNDLLVGRADHAATLLPNGKVLITGGRTTREANVHALASAELYDPQTAVWSSTGSMRAPHFRHTATLLTSGKVLIVDSAGTAELYDPATGTFTETGSLKDQFRRQHTATLLADGRVLVAGGAFPPTASAELYDPATGTWSVTGSMKCVRYQHTATLLDSGKVLVVSGNAYDDDAIGESELYDPTTGMWSDNGVLSTPRLLHAMTLLPDGRVFVTGGVNKNLSYVLAQTEIFDPQARTSQQVGGLQQPRIAPALTLLPEGRLPDGQVVVTGGYGYGPPGTQSTSWAYPEVESYNPASERWYSLPSLQQGRFGHTATYLPGRGLLIVGGFTTDYASVLQSVELYTSSFNSLLYLPVVQSAES